MLRKYFNAFLSIFAFTLIYSFTAIVVLITIVLVTLDKKTLLNAVLKLWSKTIFLILGKKIKISGAENMRSDDKYILVANHTSIFDIPAIMLHFPDIAWFGREYLLKIPVFGKALKMLGYTPVRTSGVRNAKEILNHLVEASDSKSIAIFPEGTRTLDGELLPFYKGFIRVMQASKMDIIPVTLNGFFQLKPKTTWIIDFSSILEIVIHERLTYETILNKPDQEIIDLTRQCIGSGLKQPYEYENKQ